MQARPAFRAAKARRLRRRPAAGTAARGGPCCASPGQPIPAQNPLAPRRQGVSVGIGERPYPRFFAAVMSTLPSGQMRMPRTLGFMA